MNNMRNEICSVPETSPRFARPVATCPGDNATVEVMLACSELRPEKMSAGSVMK